MTARRSSLSKEPWLAVPDPTAWPNVGQNSANLWGNEWSTTWTTPSASIEKKIEPKKIPAFSTSWASTPEPETLASHVEQLKIADIPSTKSKKKVEEELEKPAAVDDEVAKQSLYKTELCRSFVETGVCRYGHKCQFAHGAHEMRPVARHPKYKTENCKTYVTSGHCPYGNRCRFIHPPSGAQWSSSWNSKNEDEKEIPYPVPELALMPASITTVDKKPIQATESSNETVEEKEKRLSFFKRLAS